MSNKKIYDSLGGIAKKYQNIKKTIKKKMPAVKKKVLSYKWITKRWWFWVICGGILLIIIMAAINGANVKRLKSEIETLNSKSTETVDTYSYEVIDIKGKKVSEACRILKDNGWNPYISVVSSENESRQGDCYSDYIIQKYTYNESFCSSGNTDYDIDRHYVCIVAYDDGYTGPKTEEQKKQECEAEGKWYRNSRCQTEEEWNNEYAWDAAHSACKKYGSSAYAKTLTDCYLGNEYQGKVDGEPKKEEKTPTQSSSSNGSVSWREFLKEYEEWVDEYVDFMKKYRNASSSDALAMMSDYFELLGEMTDWAEKASDVEDDLSGDELSEYLKTWSRIYQKLGSIEY